MPPVTTPLTATCTKCHVAQPISEFNKDSQKRSGRRSSCRSCESKWKASSEHCRKYEREYYAANKERIRLRKMARYNKMPEVLRAQVKASRERHIGKRRAYERARRVAKAEQLRLQSAAYKKAHPEARRAYEALRRARKRGCSPDSRKALLAFLKWTRSTRAIPCYWCGRKTSKLSRHVDHIIPLAKGGTDAIANLCVACATCNTRKGAKLPQEFSGQAEMAFL